MKIGNKIRKIRELKNITPKDMADRLDMSLSGYQKIEREDVAVNVERLLEIAEVFGMKPEDVLTFDEKYVLNSYGEKSTNQVGEIHNNYPEKLEHLHEERARLLEDKLKLQEEKNQLLLDKINYLQEKIKGLEGQ